MAKSRYFTNNTLFNIKRQEPVHFATWNIPVKFRGYAPADILGSQQTFQYVWKFGDRIDRLAGQYLGDGEYWWIICLINNVGYPLGIRVGTILEIPLDTRSILERLDLI